MSTYDSFVPPLRLPVLTRLGDLMALAQAPVAVALALAAGLALAAWIAGALGLGAPPPLPPLLIL